MKKILLLNGPNLNYLGKREPDIYGTATLTEVTDQLLNQAKTQGCELECFQTNCEGAAIDKLYSAVEEGVDGVVMNPAGFTFAGYSLKDCLKAILLPYIEVHISNISKRKIESVLSDIAQGVIYGFGVYGYELALTAMLNLLNQSKQ